MKNLWIWAAVVIVAGGYLIVNKDKATPLDANAAPIKIGIATILSGDLAVAGENMVNAARLTIDEINTKGGVNGHPLELTVEDSKCDSKTGLAAITKLVSVDGIRYIVGGMCSNGTIAAAPVANENKAIVMTPVTGGSNVDAAGEYIFRTANSDILAGRDIANAMLKMGYKKVASVSEVTEYTLDIAKSFKETIMAGGGAIAIDEQFQPGTNDFRTIIAKLKARGADAILIASQTGLSAGNFMKQVKEQKLDAPLFSDFTLALNGDAKKIVGSFEGLYFADPAYDGESAAWKDFLAAYKAKYERDPLIAFHAAATHDAIMMMVVGLRAEGDDSAKVKDWLLENIKKWTGLMGTFSLDANGNSDLGFVMKQIRNDAPVPVD